MNGLVFGIDLGIASCGWAVLRHPTPGDLRGEIVGMGSWMFDVPETDKERTPTNQLRRGNRLLRRVIRRRAQRMAAIRGLFHDHGLIAARDPDALKRASLDPWELRARGLDKVLKPAELAVALGNIAKRRGFKSAAKSKEANTVGDDQKMLKALEGTRERLGRYRTMGEMFARDVDFGGRKRNRDGLFDRTQGRDDLVHEVSELFRVQRRLGNDVATEKLEQAFGDIAFRQLPMQDSERLVGMCPFEPKEKRAAKFAPSFERFRLLSRLVNLRIDTGDGERPLTVAELTAASADAGRTARLSVKVVRKRIGLPMDRRFTAFKADEEDRDIVARTGEALHGTKRLRDALGERLWNETPAEMLDAIAHALSFFETQEAILRELGRLPLPAGAHDALSTALDSGAFSRFKGAGQISSKAARAIIGHLETGARYDQACERAAYDHAASRWSRREQVTDKAAFNRLVSDIGAEIANPIARKSLTEGLKQLWAMRNRWGLPDAVHIELARDVGNSIEKRREIERGIEKNTRQRDVERAEAADLLGIDKGDLGGDTLLRYRLWKEQAGRCPYTDRAIAANAIDARDNGHQVDHILPWSRFGDDSFANKVLCVAEANQRKKGQTPFEWIMASHGEDGWRTFVARIEGNAAYRGPKKRNYVLKNAKDAEDRFRSRNLNDTRYAARLLAEAVKLFFPEGERQEKGGIRRVFTRPGGLTAALRHAWGVESLKKVDGKRVDDARHHALDALVVAAIGESEINRLTRSYQEWEQQGLARPLRRVDPPWGDFHDFRREVEIAYQSIFVARPERRRARGEGHAATIRQVKERDGETVVFERKAIVDLPEKRLADIKDADRNGAVIEAIRQWIADGRPADRLPRSPAGDEIRKVRLRAKGKPAVAVRGGAADRGEMVRVDVFSKTNRRGKDEFHLVPVYPHQVMDLKTWQQPPSRAVVADKDEDDWTPIDDNFTFRFSLHPRSHVEVTKPSGEILSGYFRGMDRSTGAISLFNHRDSRRLVDDNGNSTRGVGAKTLLIMKKYSVDRFGRRAEVKSEVRTWHGEVCISPTPPD